MQLDIAMELPRCMGKGLGSVTSGSYPPAAHKIKGTYFPTTTSLGAGRPKFGMPRSMRSVELDGTDSIISGSYQPSQLGDVHDTSHSLFLFLVSCGSTIRNLPIHPTRVLHWLSADSHVTRTECTSWDRQLHTRSPNFPSQKLSAQERGAFVKP